MLEGSLHYYDTELARDIYYDVWGYPFQSNLSLVLRPINEDSITYFTDDTDHKVTQNFPRGERLVEIHPTNVSVETTLNEETIKAYSVTKTLPSLMGLSFNFMVNLGTQNYINMHKQYKDGYVNYKYSQEGVRFDPKAPATTSIHGSIEYPTRHSGYFPRKFEFSCDTFSFELHEVNKPDTMRLPYSPASTTVTFNVKRLFKDIGITDIKKLDFDGTADERGVFLKHFSEVMSRYPNKRLLWLEKQNFHMVNDSNVEEVVEYLKKFPVRAVDTETTGLHITFKSKSFVQDTFSDQLVGVIVSPNETEAYFFPLQMNTVPNLCEGNHALAMSKYLKELLEMPTVLFNAAFDAKVFMVYDIEVDLVMDVMIALQDTLGYEEGIKRINLKDMTTRFLNRDAIEINELTRSGDYSDANFADVPEELVLVYACADGINTFCLYKYIVDSQLLEKHNANGVVNLDSQFSIAIAYQEFYGQHIDVDDVPRLRAELKEDMETNVNIMKDCIVKQTSINEKAGRDPLIDPSNFNPNSVQQMLKIAYEGMNIPVQLKFDSKTRRKKPTLDKSARKDLLGSVLEKDTLEYTFIQAYKDYNDSNTMVKNFTKKLGQLMSPDGYTFSKVNQFLMTGRLAVADPPYQNYSKPIKKYITPRPGFGMSDNDFQSIEYKVIAGLSGQERLLEAFKDPNTDYHRLQASNMFEIPYALVTTPQRSQAKKFNFGLPFGMGDQTLGERLYGERSAENTAKAGLMRKKYFQGQEKVEAFFDTRRANAVRDGYSETYFGRRRYYDKRTQSVGDIKRKAGNQPIQGTAADMFKYATIRMYKTIIKNHWQGKVLLSGFVHDEMLIEVHKSIHPLDWLAMLKEQVELKIPGFPTIFLGWGYGANWYQAKVFDIPTQLQNELIANGAEKEYPNWDGDSDKFNQWLVKRVEKFETDQIIGFVTDKNNAGQPITPVMWGYLEDKISDMEPVKNADHDLTLEEQLGYLKELYKLDYVADLTDPTKTDDGGGVLDDVAVASDNVSAQSQFAEDSITNYTERTDEDQQAKYALHKLKQRLNWFGASLDSGNNKVIVLKDREVLTWISQNTEDPNTNTEAVPVEVFDSDSETLIQTKVYVSYTKVHKFLEPLYSLHHAKENIS